MDAGESGKMRVFISYGRKDVYPKDAVNPVERERHFPIVEKVYRHLKALGLLPWLDKYDLTTDREFTDSINYAVEQCDYMLLFIGSHSMASEWCAKEWKHALKHCKPIIPILLEGDWGDEKLIQTYPARIRNTDGINPERSDGTLDEKHLMEKIAQALRLPPKPLTTPYNAQKLPDWYIERPQYIEALKKQLAVNDKDYSGSNIVGITSEQEVAALQGIGGIGKTTLAKAICADCDVRRNFDQIFWLDIGPQVNADSVPTVMQIIGAAFNDNLDYYQQLATARARLQHFFAGKRNLIVLDDVWQEGIVEQFSLAGVDCRLLVTTRNKALVADSQPIQKLSEEEGLRLLATVFDPHNPQPDALTADHRAIVRKLDGYTLALEITGKWLNKFGKSAADYLTRLESDEAKLFDHLQLSKTDKNANLARSLALSYDALERDDQGRFRQLGVFAPNASFDEAALKAVWQADELLYPLQTLLDLGLLDVDADGRYSQHVLLHAYALQLLKEADEYDTAFERYADHYIGVARQFDELPPEKWRDTVERDIANLIKIYDTLMQMTLGDIETLDKTHIRRLNDLTFNTTLYISTRRDVSQSAWLETGVMTSRLYRNLADHSEIRKYENREVIFLIDIGTSYRMEGNLSKALEYYDTAHELAREITNTRYEANALNGKGLVLHMMGKLEEAKKLFEEALAISQALNDLEGISTSVNNLGLICLDSGDIKEALHHFNFAISIMQNESDSIGLLSILTNFGLACLKMGLYEDALSILNDTLCWARNTGDKFLIAHTLNIIGGVHTNSGRLSESLICFEESLSLFQEIRDTNGIAHALGNIGASLFQIGQWEEGLKYSQNALFHFQTIGAVKEIEILEADISHMINNRKIRPVISPQVRKYGRNELCYCGSGKKYKHCHLAIDRNRNRKN